MDFTEKILGCIYRNIIPQFSLKQAGEDVRLNFRSQILVPILSVAGRIKEFLFANNSLLMHEKHRNIPHPALQYLKNTRNISLFSISQRCRSSDTKD